VALTGYGPGSEVGVNVVIGAGVGGLCAALHWRRQGLPVTVLEARSVPGGLASATELAGRRHDVGPYVLLDRPGLEWAFHQLGLRLEDELELLRLEEPYRVEAPGTPTVVIRDGLDETADGLERDFPGAGDRYRAYVARLGERYARLAPLQRAPFRGPVALLSGGRWRDAPFLLRSLGSELAAARLPPPVVDALAVWTHVAGQPLAAAPSVMALVPAVIHQVGAYFVKGGMGSLVDALARAAVAAGVELRFGERVDRIVRDGPHVVAVEVGGRRLPVERVVSDAPALTTLCTLLSPPEPAVSDPLRSLPLQSPGVAAWLHVDPAAEAPFLRFRLEGGRCAGLLHPGAVDETLRGRARLFAPLDHAWAEQVGADGQRAALDALLAETWWRGGLGDVEVVGTRIPVEWGAVHHLWRDSMNPTMTAAFLRRGRVPHHPPGLPTNLSLCGAATHPGQWVSFCAISGILATSPRGR
jgi:phytoene dehydrogenase-like protein